MDGCGTNDHVTCLAATNAAALLVQRAVWPPTAMLLKWHNVEGHYDGLIIVAAPNKDGAGWAIVEMWTDSALLSPD